ERSDKHSGQQNSADGKHDKSDDWENELAPDGFVFEAVINDPEAEGNQGDTGNVMRELPELCLWERREPSAEEKNCGEAGDRDHRGVFRDEKHGELEASIFRMKTGNQFRLSFGEIERCAVGFRDGRSKEADEADDLGPEEALMRPGKNVPAKDADAPLGVCLLHDDFLEAEGVSHEEHADDGHGEGEFVTNHLRRAAKPAEERIL